MTAIMRRTGLAVLILICILAGGSQAVMAQPTGWSAPRYINISGTVFRPRSSLSTWNYLSQCLVVTSNPLKVFNVPIQLPQGARIEYLSFSYLNTLEDEDPYSSQAYLAIYDGHGGVTDLAALYTGAPTGYQTIVSPYIGHIVDNASYSYLLSYKAVEVGESRRLCGMRVTYRVPVENIFMPLMAK